MRTTKESFLQLLEVIEDEAAAKFESRCRHKSYWVMLPPYVYVYLFPYFYGILLVQGLQPPKPLDFMNYNCMSWKEEEAVGQQQIGGRFGGQIVYREPRGKCHYYLLMASEASSVIESVSIIPNAIYRPPLLSLWKCNRNTEALLSGSNREWRSPNDTVFYLLCGLTKF